eukprot:CAMPEP_0197044232 /NCGR_PEP_ID=MMETSP1384-20130603/20332_1 /TAXON_ID=29189 /ORGANISM="Ammonia sp." /LENGTH=1020 /DNA_ID=CAMNT_0042475657 /DNA_START=88 /DNA_END=3150 /DNA_ORIENTATION=-
MSNKGPRSSGTGNSKYNVSKKKQPPSNRKPPSKPQPTGPKPSSPKPAASSSGPPASVVQRLQQLITEKDTKIEKLTERINALSMENKSLQRKVETLEKASASPKKSTPSKPAGGGGIDNGVSQAGAANALAGLLGGHVKNKKLAEDKANSGGSGGGVESGMSQAGAANALAGLFGGKVKNKKLAGDDKAGGVEKGPSQAGAAAALGGLFKNKNKPAPSSPAKSSGGGGGGGGKKGGKDDFSQYASLFKKYEMMMKLGINVHGAVGRMRQEGVDKAAIAAFEKKHGAVEEEEVVDAASLGLKEKKEVPVSKGIKMKRLHWDAVNVKEVKGSVWEELDESQIKYDRKHFELHFQVRQRKPQDENEKKSGPKVEAGQIITFVSKKRTQAVLIGLKNLNLDNDQLRDVLHNMDETVMSVDTLSKLLDMVPTMDEQTEAEKKIMQEGTRRVKDYGVVEQFFFALCDFYNLQQRLKLWMFKQNFHEICDSLLDQYKTVGKACDKIRNNKNLKLLLTIIMAFGNHMNSGTRKGCVYGFDLKILTQMTAVKSFDNTRSLLMYVYEFCDRKYPNAIKVLPELTDTLKAASSMEVETLKQAYERIQENMKEVKNLITSDEIENYDIDDKFIMVLTDFHKTAAPKMKKFNMTVGNVMVSTKRVMKKFSYGSEEEPKSIESFFQIWWKFVQDFGAAKEKLIDLEKERQKRIEKRKKAKDKARKKELHQKYGNRSLPPNKAAPGGGDDDDSSVSQSSSLYKEAQKRNQFEKQKADLHGKLGGHVKQRSIFIASGGKLEGQPQNDTMRRLSSMYQTQQEQVKALEDARKKAAILQYNKFRLPGVGAQAPLRKRWGTGAGPELFQGGFEIPDDKQMMAPMGNPSRNTRPMPASGRNGGGNTPASPTKSPPQQPANGHPSPFQRNKPGSNQFGKQPLKIQPKQPQANGKGAVPPPPNSTPPASNGAMPGAYPVYGQNPQGAWAQQGQQLGYGSNPNLSYQNAYGQPHAQQRPMAMNTYNNGQQKAYYNQPQPFRKT